MTQLYIENECVQKIYDQIGKHFDQTRYNVWPSVKEFINSLLANSLTLDAGIGNGKNTIIRDDLTFIGCDFSQTLVEICYKKNINVLLANIKNLPFKDNTFDAVICVAVLHHLSTSENRQLAISELSRVLKPNGKLFISVWAREQELTKQFIKINENNQENDYFVLWNNKKNEQFKRYYHLFTQEEVKLLFPKANITFENNNWNIIISK